MPVQKKVLVIEDHPDSRQMLELVLKEEGYTVITAEDGLAGLNLAKVEKPDAIITNINMPNLDGKEMIKRVRQVPGLRKIPIVVLSAVRSDDPEALINIGATAVTSKPIELKIFLETLNKALQGIAEQGQTTG
jgi:CheY-like chemotaxis protein